MLAPRGRNPNDPSDHGGHGQIRVPVFQFVRGHLEDTDDGKELLTLRFPSDTVEIRGKQLEPLEKALDDLSLAWVRVLPSRYARLVPEGSPVVTGILVLPLDGEGEGD